MITAVRSSEEFHGFFTNRRGRRLYHVLHGSATTAKASWIFCNALFEEKTFSQRSVVLLAREFAQQGHSVLRFDYEGDGDSEGDVHLLRAGDRVADVLDAVDFMKSQYPGCPLRLFSMRAGALVATAAAAQLSSPAQLLLFWEPILSGASYVKECMRANLTTQLSVHRRIVETSEQMMARLRAGGSTVNFSGYEVGAELVNELQAWSLPSLVAASGSLADLVHVARTDSDGFPLAWTSLVGLPGATLHRCRATPPWLQSSEYEDSPRSLTEISVLLGSRADHLEPSAA